jgi:predicted Ser/Thr protein kinase
VDFKSISLNKVIGCGNAGEVYEGSLQNKTVAIKKIKSKQQNPNAHKEF